MANKLPLDTLPDWPLLLSIGEAARYLGVSEKTFRELNPVEKIHIGAKTVRYHIQDLQRFALSLKREGEKTPNRALIDEM